MKSPVLVPTLLRGNARWRRSASRQAPTQQQDGTQSVQTCVPTQERGNESHETGMPAYEIADCKLFGSIHV